MTCKVCKWAQHPPCEKRIPCCDCHDECDSRQCVMKHWTVTVKRIGQPAMTHEFDSAHSLEGIRRDYHLEGRDVEWFNVGSKRL